MWPPVKVVFCLFSNASKFIRNLPRNIVTNKIASWGTVQTMQVERLFKIVFLLMNGTCSTAKELAEHCSVSVRTIQRDIEALSIAGIPVYSTRGYGGGVGLLKEFTLDKTFMTEREQADILHGLQALESVGYPDIHESFNKFAAIFRRKAEDRWLLVDFSSWGDSGFGKEKFARLKEAILTKRAIRFTYLALRR